MGMADIHAQHLPAVCPHTLPWLTSHHPLLLPIMALGREPRTAKKWEECGLWKVVQNTKAGIWIRAMRKCRCAGNTLV